MKEITQQRQIEEIPYSFKRKKVKNINVRVRQDASVAVSAPLRCADARVEAFLRDRLSWLRAARLHAQQAQPQDIVPCTVTPQEAMALFTRVSEEIFPLFAEVLAGVRPTLKVRAMKTRWGVCKIAARQITLNLRLAQQPRAAVEYVVLHEYAHFIVGNHSPAFWAVVAQYMPDYKARRQLLRMA